MVSILVALAYVLLNDIAEIHSPNYDKELKLFDWAGIPYFFGTAMFMFEGNAVALEIY
jgi:hypothetical protein